MKRPAKPIKLFGAGILALCLVGAGPATAQTGEGVASANPGKGKAKGKSKGKTQGKNFVPGSRSLGDPLFPQIGNGGYDAKHYKIAIDYDPAENRFRSAKAVMFAAAEQNLSSFSMDFQALDVSRVRVDGRPAKFRQVEATPDLSDNPDVTQPMKLVVKPARGLHRGKRFKVRVDYAGVPEHITDPDTSIEGWIRACINPGFTPPCDGSHVVNEPIGAQSWFPSNNYPTDKARFDTILVVPSTHIAFGVGELVQRRTKSGSTRWHWREDEPTATYLTTATVGLFDYTRTSMREGGNGRSIPIDRAIDSSYSAVQKQNVNESLDLIPDMHGFFANVYGRYPFDSTGAIVDRVPDVGYALEVQTKSHFSRLGTTTNDISDSTLAHEIAHQWMGNAVTLARWNDIWFNEGWATWSEWIWNNARAGGPSPAEIFDELYADTPDEEWEVAPAVLDGDPSLLFSGFPQYDRGAMVIQGTREIVGEDRFRFLIRVLMNDFRYGNISTEQFIGLVKRVSGFSGERRGRLDAFLRQWLYGETKPTLLPEDV